MAGTMHDKTTSHRPEGESTERFVTPLDNTDNIPHREDHTTFENQKHQPEAPAPHNKVLRRVGGAVGSVLFIGAALIGMKTLTGSGNPSSAGMGPTPADTGGTVPPLAEFNPFPSYTENFEPVVLAATSVGELVDELRQDFYRAIVSRNPNTRDAYISYMVDENPALIGNFRDSITDAQSQYVMSGFTADDYFTDGMDIWELLGEDAPLGNTVAVDIRVTDQVTGEYRDTDWNLQQIEDSTSPTGTRYVVTSVVQQ